MEAVEFKGCRGFTVTIMDPILFTELGKKVIEHDSNWEGCNTIPCCALETDMSLPIVPLKMPKLTAGIGFMIFDIVKFISLIAKFEDIAFDIVIVLPATVHE